MQACARCGGTVERRHRYCPWCALPLRAKLVEFFAPHPGLDCDREKALRVSRYTGSPDSPPQVRFSIWNVDRAQAAISLDEAEAARLASFVAPPAAARASVIDQIRESLRL